MYQVSSVTIVGVNAKLSHIAAGAAERVDIIAVGICINCEGLLAGRKTNADDG